MFEVGPLSLNIAKDDIRAKSPVSSHLERNAGRGVGFDLQDPSGDRVVLLEKVIGGFSEVLECAKRIYKAEYIQNIYISLPSKRGEQAEECWT